MTAGARARECPETIRSAPAYVVDTGQAGPDPEAEGVALTKRMDVARIGRSFSAREAGQAIVMSSLLKSFSFGAGAEG